MAQCTQFFFCSASKTQFGALKCIRRGACINTCPVSFWTLASTWRNIVSFRSILRYADHAARFAQ